jgi:hypothetical protein
MPFRYSVTKEDIANKPEPVPPGEYNLIIRETTLKTTKVKPDGNGGDPMVSAKCEIDDAGPHLGRKIWHNVIFWPEKDKEGKRPKARGLAVHFLKAIGEPYPENGGEFDVDENNWIGRRFKAAVAQETYEGVTRNKIKFVITDESKGDDIPF